jgi:hypothetical protein
MCGSVGDRPLLRLSIVADFVADFVEIPPQTLIIDPRGLLGVNHSRFATILVALPTL